MIKRIILIVLFFSFPDLYAQLAQLRIEGKPEKSATEIVSRRDANGRLCAAIQIISDMDGFSYDSYNGIVGDVDDRAGMDIVYLTPDERVLQIFQSGYEPLKIIISEIGIRLKEKEMWVLKISGQKKLGNIPIAIITQPTGAQVNIDGQNLGAIESYTISEGQHTIRLNLPGYEPLIETIFVDENNALFKFILNKIKEVPIEIKSLPEGATVFIDNVKFGVTPLTDFYPTGKYSIRLEKEWYVIYEDFIEIKAPNTREVIRLKEDFGSLLVTTTPETGLDIIIDGKASNYKTPYTFDRLKPATYSISAKSQYFESDEKTVTISREGKHSIQLQSRANYATLNIITEEGVQIFINDKLMTQRKNIRLEPQVVRVRAQKPPKGKAVEQRVVLKKNDNQTIEIYPDMPTGTIQIAVNPFDANIELKGDAGEFYFSRQSSTFNNIPVGTYNLAVTKDRYKPHNETIKLIKDEKILKKIVLKELKFAVTDFVEIDRSKPPNQFKGHSPDPKPVDIIDKDGYYNLALLKKAKATASSLIRGYNNIHQIQFLNDGWYNNCRSWIPDKMPAWIELDLGDEYLIHYIKIGSEHDSFHKDRAATKFKIYVAKVNSPSAWLEVYASRTSWRPLRDTTKIKFSPVRARFVRINFEESIDGNVRIDEFEIYGSG